jgi:hypothetical protein
LFCNRKSSSIKGMSRDTTRSSDHRRKASDAPRCQIDEHTATKESQLSGPGARRNSNVRWIVCGLLFLAATVNYTDRQVIGILKPTLQLQGVPSSLLAVRASSLWITVELVGGNRLR